MTVTYRRQRFDPIYPRHYRVRRVRIDEILPQRTIRDGTNWVVLKLGDEYDVKIRRDEVLSKEVLNLQLLRHRTTSIPLQEGIRDEVTSDGFQCSWLTQAHGHPLISAWHRLGFVEKQRIAAQVGTAIMELRGLTNPRAMRLGGEPLYNGHLFRTRGTGYGIPHGPMESDDEIWAEMAPGLGKRAVIEGPGLRRDMPPCAPFTFTHGGLTMDNIIVRGDRLVAITGWEYAGFFPVWWEYVALMRSGISANTLANRRAEEWRFFLSREMPQYSEAWGFWHRYDEQCSQPDM